MTSQRGAQMPFLNSDWDVSSAPLVDGGARYLLIPSAAAATRARRATESGSRSLTALRFIRARDGLADNYQLAFPQIAFHDFRGSTIR